MSTASCLMASVSVCLVPLILIKFCAIELNFAKELNFELQEETHHILMHPYGESGHPEDSDNKTCCNMALIALRA